MLSRCTGASGRQPVPTPRCRISQTLYSPCSSPPGHDTFQVTDVRVAARCQHTGHHTLLTVLAVPNTAPKPVAAAHPLPCKAAWPGSGRVWEEFVQPGLPFLQHAVARGDGEQVHSQLVQGVAEQLPVVIDRVEGAAGQGETLSQPAPVSWEGTGRSLPHQRRKQLGWGSCHPGGACHWARD